MISGVESCSSMPGTKNGYRRRAVSRKAMGMGAKCAKEKLWSNLLPWFFKAFPTLKSSIHLTTITNSRRQCLFVECLWQPRPLPMQQLTQLPTLHWRSIRNQSYIVLTPTETDNFLPTYTCTTWHRNLWTCPIDSTLMIHNLYSEKSILPDASTRFLPTLANSRLFGYL